MAVPGSSVVRSVRASELEWEQWRDAAALVGDSLNLWIRKRLFEAYELDMAEARTKREE